MQNLTSRFPLTVPPFSRNYDKEDLTNIVGVYYPGMVFVVTLMPQDVPISSVVVMGDGEIRSAWRAPEYRGSKAVKKLELDMVVDALRKGHLTPTSGTLYAIVHPDNDYANETMRFRAAGVETVLEVIEKDGVQWNKWYAPVERLLREVGN